MKGLRQIKKTTKNILVKDIMELVEECYNSEMKKECLEVLQANNQVKWDSKELFKNSLGYKNKETLTKIREDIWLKVINY